MELYFEQNVTNNNVDERIKRTKVLTFVKTAFLILGVFILVMSAMLGDLFFRYFWRFVLVAIPFFVVAYILGRINKRNNVEYDYVLDDEFIKISEIYFREQRKLKHTIRLRLVDSVGVFDSEGYKKIERSANKKILALVNYDDEDSILYIYYKTEKGGHNILFLEPNKGFMIALRRAMSGSALTVFDKSISDLEKRLAQKEQEEAMLKLDDVGDEDEDYDDDELDSDNEDDINDGE
ncbi:MAG: hypothetical protein K2L88_01530 [Clostridiales bacterium]|nr:hypothetical protein [Clostridiales bacterium]